MAELKENVLNILEEKGILNSFKSQLRTQVLKAMDEFSGKGKSLQKAEVLTSLESPESQICLEVIRDFLEYMKIRNTLEIFVPECNLKRKPMRNELEDKIGIKSEIGKPILFSLLERCTQASPTQSVELSPTKFLDKPPAKLSEFIPVIGKDEKKAIPAVFKVENKPVEKQSNPLTSLPKSSDKANDRLKLQPLTSQKKVTNLRSFDVLIDEKEIKTEPVNEKIIKKFEDSPKSSIDEEIDEEVEEDHKEFYESQGTSSMGVDFSVNSLALEEFDHIENIRPPRKF